MPVSTTLLEVASELTRIPLEALREWGGLIEDLEFGGGRVLARIEGEDKLVSLEEYMSDVLRAGDDQDDGDEEDVEPAGRAGSVAAQQQTNPGEGETMDLTAAVRFVRTAEAAGLKPEVLAKLPGAEKLSFELAEGKAFVTPEGGAKQPLAEYAKKVWSEFMPALAAAAPDRRAERAGGDIKTGQAASEEDKNRPEEAVNQKRLTGAYEGM